MKKSIIAILGMTMLAVFCSADATAATAIR